AEPMDDRDQAPRVVRAPGASRKRSFVTDPELDAQGGDGAGRRIHRSCGQSGRTPAARGSTARRTCRAAIRWSHVAPMERLLPLYDQDWVQPPDQVAHCLL